MESVEGIDKQARLVITESAAHSVRLSHHRDRRAPRLFRPRRMGGRRAGPQDDRRRDRNPRRILTAFERAESDEDPDVRRRLLTFVVVGGGPTGVELAGAIAELARKAIRQRFPQHRFDDRARRACRGRRPRLLADLSRRCFRESAKRSSSSSASRCCSARRSHDATTRRRPGRRQSDRVGLRAVGGRRHGVARREMARRAGRPRRAGRSSTTTSACRASTEIFVIGDTALVNGADGRPVPGVAPAAKQMGRYVARVNPLAPRRRRRRALPLSRLRQPRHDRPQGGGRRSRPGQRLPASSPGCSGASRICGSWSASATASSSSLIGPGPMQHSIVARASSPTAATLAERLPTRAARPRRDGAAAAGRAVRRPAFVHVIWQRTASAEHRDRSSPASTRRAPRPCATN